MTIAFKACPRCESDIRPGSDHHGDFVSCITCGWMKDEPWQEPAAEFDRPVKLPYVGRSRSLKGIVLLMKFNNYAGHTVPTVFCPITAHGVQCRLQMKRSKRWATSGGYQYQCANYHSVVIIDEATWK